MDEGEGQPEARGGPSQWGLLCETGKGKGPQGQPEHRGPRLGWGSLGVKAQRLLTSWGGPGRSLPLRAAAPLRLEDGLMLEPMVGGMLSVPQLAYCRPPMQAPEREQTLRELLRSSFPALPGKWG